VWFHVQQATDFAIMDLLPKTNLETVDFALVGDALIRSGGAPRIIVNFSLLQFISAAALGHLLKLQQKVQAANGTLVLCGLNQVVRQVFQAAKLESFFAFAD
jgi:anti-sigma B factor antagonist